MTGLPRAEARLSPRTLFLLLTVLVMFFSEVVARVSLPSPGPGTQAQGIVRNFIPFRSLNRFVVGFIVLTLGWHLVVISYSSKHQEPTAEAGVFLSKTAGWIPSFIMLFMLLNNSKARAFTRRKMADWWRARWLAIGVQAPALDPVQAQVLVHALAQVQAQALVQAPAPVPAQVPVLAPAPLTAEVLSPSVAPDPEAQATGYRGWAESKLILVQEANVGVPE